MRNKIVVTIGGRDYTMVAVEDEEYVRKCAEHVDQQLKQVSSGRVQARLTMVPCSRRDW